MRRPPQPQDNDPDNVDKHCNDGDNDDDHRGAVETNAVESDWSNKIKGDNIEEANKIEVR